MLANLGLLAGLALLIVMALRGVNILVAALVASLVVAITNGMGFSAALLEHFPFGPLGHSALPASSLCCFSPGPSSAR
jgi:H+/gluconate symporter-like permease